MNAYLKCTVVAALLWAAPAQAQTAAVGKPEDNGVTPKGGTIYVNVPDTINNANTESLGVAVAGNGNVIVGWEDDGDVSGPEPLKYLAGVWTLFDANGNSITPSTPVTGLAFPGQTLNTKFLSFFRKDKSAIPGYTGWGPKIKANLFGDGVGIGVNSNNAEVDLGTEVVEFAAYNEKGGFPGVQLLTSSGSPIGIVAGASEVDTAPDGTIRIGDWNYLANGNIVVVGESRQADDMGKLGAATDRNVVYRVVDAAGKEIKAYSLVSSTGARSEMWHGVGVTRNGFAIRFASEGQTTVRLFDNNGNPTSANINLAERTTKPVTGGGGRGDGTGFHGNGADAYVTAVSGADETGAKVVWVTVLNADGTVRYSVNATDGYELAGADRVDAAIHADGRVLVVFDDAKVTDAAFRLVQGRLLDAAGKPMGGVFLVSEKEGPGVATGESRRARVAWVGTTAAVVWESRNSGVTGDRVVAARLFSIAPPLGGIETVGLARIVPDQVLFKTDNPNLDNWEPSSGVIGNSVFVVEANTFAEGSSTHQNYAVAFQPVAGGAHARGEGFFADNGTAYRGEINGSRQNGNPGRVGGDKRPGAVHFMVGGEASPHDYPVFQSDNRWSLGFVRDAGIRYATVQAYSLNPATLAQTPTSKALDAINGRQTTGAPATTPEAGRFGGDVVALDNGNFLVVADDRSNVHAADRAATAVIIAPNGSIVKESFAIGTGQIWANVAAFKGGFAVRLNGMLRFYDNAGTFTGEIDQNESKVGFDRGRGDGTRLAAHINSPFVFLAGAMSETDAEGNAAEVVRVSAWDSRTRTFAGETKVNDLKADFDRVNVAADALDRVAVAYEAIPSGYEKAQVLVRVLAWDGAAKQFKGLTSSFLPFINNGEVAYRTIRPTVSMTTKEILVAAKGEINMANKPDQAPDSLPQTTFYTVFAHPDPKNDPTAGVGGGSGAQLSATRNGSNIVLSWTASGLVLQSASSITGPWTTVATTGNTHTAAIAGGAMFFRLGSP